MKQRHIATTLKISDIKKASRATTFDFFNNDSRKYFDTIVLPEIYQGHGGIFFITSEQVYLLDGTPSSRGFTVRQFNETDSSIQSIGLFNELTESQAIARAKQLANGLINPKEFPQLDFVLV